MFLDCTKTGAAKGPGGVEYSLFTTLSLLLSLLLCLYYSVFTTLSLLQVQRKALEEWNTRLESMHKGDRDKYGLV